MLEKRVIPLLLLIDRGFYKTIKFKNPVYLGDPINIIKIFNEKYVDELIILDINASKRKTGPDFDFLRRIATECFIPLTYGGGIATLDDAKKLFSIGIEKISINYQLLLNPSLLTVLSNQFGSQSIVASIDIKLDMFKRPRVFSHVTNSFFKIQIEDLLHLCIDNGVGEILLNFVDKDGTLSGMNLSPIALFLNQLKVPVIAAGGINSFDNICESLKFELEAVAVGSFFVFHGPRRAVLIKYLNENQLKIVRHI